MNQVEVIPTFDPIESFLAQVPVNRSRVMSEARHFARKSRKLEKKLFGGQAASLRYCATEGMSEAMAREESRRRSIANSMYINSLPLPEREKIRLETEFYLLRTKLIGCHMLERERIEKKMAELAERIVETTQPERDVA
jgi:hypothetical protein